MDKKVDVPKLREFFEKAGCPGVVSLIDFLASPEGASTVKIGSGSLDFDGVLGDDSRFTNEAKKATVLFGTHSLYLGSFDGSVTPLESLLAISCFFARLSELERKRFNDACAAFADLPRVPATASGNATVVSKLVVRRTCKE